MQTLPREIIISDLLRYNLVNIMNSKNIDGHKGQANYID